MLITSNEIQGMSRRCVHTAKQCDSQVRTGFAVFDLAVNDELYGIEEKYNFTSSFECKETTSEVEQESTTELGFSGRPAAIILEQAFKDYKNGIIDIARLLELSSSFADDCNEDPSA